MHLVLVEVTPWLYSASADQDQDQDQNQDQGQDSTQYSAFLKDFSNTHRHQARMSISIFYFLHFFFLLYSDLSQNGLDEKDATLSTSGVSKTNYV